MEDNESAWIVASCCRHRQDKRIRAETFKKKKKKKN